MIVTVFCCVEHKKAVPGNNHKRPDIRCLGTPLLLAIIWARHVIYLAQIHLP